MAALCGVVVLFRTMPMPGDAEIIAITDAACSVSPRIGFRGVKQILPAARIGVAMWLVSFGAVLGFNFPGFSFAHTAFGA